MAESLTIARPYAEAAFQLARETESLSSWSDALARLFEALRNEFEGVLEAHVSSAYPLNDAQVEDIVKTLEKKFGRSVKANVRVDSELIGGVSIRIGDEVMDASVRGKLAQLADALKK